MEDKKIVTPVQPYLTLDAEDYQELLNRRMGISSFYEFNVKTETQGIFGQFQMGVQILFLELEKRM